MRRVLIGLALALAVLPAWAQTRNNNATKCDAGDVDACTALIQSGRGTKDDRASAYRLRGMDYIYKKGLVDQAIADYTKAIALEPSFYVYNERGSAYERKGLHDQAIADYTKAITLDPSSSDFFSIDSYNERGSAYERKGLVDQAIADYTKAIALDTDGKKGLNAVKQQDWNLALQSFLSVQADYSDNPTILFNLGLTSEKLPGHELRAIAWFQAYLLRAPWARDAAAVRIEVARLETSYEAGNRAILDQLDLFVPQAKKTIAQLSPSFGADWAENANSEFPDAAMNVASSHYLMADEPGALRVLGAAGIDIFPGGRLVVPPSQIPVDGTKHLVTGMLSNHLHVDEILGTKAPDFFLRDELAQLDYLIEFGDLDRAKLFLERGAVNGNLWLLGEERLLCAAHERTDHTLFNQVSKLLEAMLEVGFAKGVTKTPFASQVDGYLGGGLGIPDLVRLYLELGEVDRAKALADFKQDDPAAHVVADSLIDDFQKGRIRAAGVCPAELSVLADDPSKPLTWGSGDGTRHWSAAALWWSTGRLAFLTSVGRQGVTYTFYLDLAKGVKLDFDETQDLAAIQKVSETIAASPADTVFDLDELFEFEFEILNTYRMVRGHVGP